MDNKHHRNLELEGNGGPSSTYKGKVKAKWKTFRNSMLAAIKCLEKCCDSNESNSNTLFHCILPQQAVFKQRKRDGHFKGCVARYRTKDNQGGKDKKMHFAGDKMYFGC